MKDPQEDPPCGDCRAIASEENEDALKVFFMVLNQLIMGSNGPVGINHLAIHETMKLYKVKNRRDCFEKVTFLERWWIGRMREESDKT